MIFLQEMLAKWSSNIPKINHIEISCEKFAVAVKL